jgi:hypothetical protein
MLCMLPPYPSGIVYHHVLRLFYLTDDLNFVDLTTYWSPIPRTKQMVYCQLALPLAIKLHISFHPWIFDSVPQTTENPFSPQ